MSDESDVLLHLFEELDRDPENIAVHEMIIDVWLERDEGGTRVLRNIRLFRCLLTDTQNKLLALLCISFLWIRTTSWHSTAFRSKR